MDSRDMRAIALMYDLLTSHTSNSDLLKRRLRWKWVKYHDLSRAHFLMFPSSLLHHFYHFHRFDSTSEYGSRDEAKTDLCSLGIVLSAFNPTMPFLFPLPIY